MPCGRFPRGMYISVVKFQLDIHGQKGIHKNRLFIYFGGSNHLLCISRILCCSLDPVLGTGYDISCILL